VIFNLLERHRDKWVEDGECYRWIAATAGNPKSLQGCVGWNGKVVRVPRAMCEEAHGPPPTPKHHAAHDTPNGCIGSLCVNGEHLRWATARENAADISSEVRSDRIRRGAINIPIEVKRSRSRAANAARWSKK
jgi:hypothetical protein